jgi:hypothetical protein
LCFERLSQIKNPHIVAFFVRLASLYDLRRFRIIPVRQSQQLFAKEPEQVGRYLAALVRAQVLEVSSMRVAGGYRLCLECQASLHFLKEWVRDTKETRERLHLVDPNPPPADPDLVRQWLETGKN